MSGVPCCACKAWKCKVTGDSNRNSTTYKGCVLECTGYGVIAACNQGSCSGHTSGTKSGTASSISDSLLKCTTAGTDGQTSYTTESKDCCCCVATQGMSKAGVTYSEDQITGGIIDDDRLDLLVQEIKLENIRKNQDEPPLPERNSGDLITEATMEEWRTYVGMSEGIEVGQIITIAEINTIIDELAKVGALCACNCNYCTCNCNYCTCNCNYCSCNCNYSDERLKQNIIFI